MRTIKFFFAVAIATVAKAQWGGGGASAGQRLTVGNGQTQHKGVADGYSYEIWLDNTGGSGSMTLGSGATFKAEWNASVNRGNFLARRGLDFGSQKKATDYSYIGLDYTATYRQTGSASGNSRLCVYGWFQNRGVQGVPLVEYYIIEDWVDWVPDAQGRMVTIDGAQYKIFQMDHTGPTINGGSETFKQYFSVRQQKRTSGHITVSDHFKEWAKQGWGIGNLYEVALNAEGWQSSGIADVTKLDVYTTQKGSNPAPTSTGTVPSSSAGGSTANGKKFTVGNGQNQHKGVNDGFSYEIWLDNTGGNGSMTLGSGATFKAEWNAAVNRGNFLARRGLDFGSQKKATDYDYIGLDYAATYKQTASASGNSRLCVYGWFQNRGLNGVPLVEYYIIEDWVDWVPDAQGKMVTIDGAQYKIFQMDHTGPTINGGSETFKQYFSVRQQKRTSGHITVSDHFKEWAKQGWGIGNLYEVALNAEGWQSSGVADVTLLDVYTTPKGSSPATSAAPRTTTRTTTRTKSLPTNYNKCSARITAQGYKCCSDPNCVVYYTDEDGTWGVENNDWCGCGVEQCSSKITSQGYKCCSDPNCVVFYTDDDGKWGVENNDWCGCGF
nr:xylanase A, XYLA [Neocallimastix patriciarum, Peptide, 607 aa] [Neocallimastix patriciarum]